MKKKHYITTIADIKYCEENGRTIWSAIDVSNYYYKFSNGVWCRYRENDEGKEDDLFEYNSRLCVSLNDTNILYYYEEESEEKPKITKDDLGKKAIFPDGSIGELRFIVKPAGKNFMYGKDACTFYKSCEIVEEQQEATEKDIGKLCWFWDVENNKFIEVLAGYDKDCEIPYECGVGWYNKHCRPLTKAEIQEFMEKAE